MVSQEQDKNITVISKREGHSGEASPKIRVSRDTIVMVSSFPVITW
jgi:hypothetical protein